MLLQYDPVYGEDAQSNQFRIHGIDTFVMEPEMTSKCMNNCTTV